MVSNLDRVCRRLRAAHERSREAVGVRADGVVVTLWQGWCDARGRLRVLEVRSDRAYPLSLDATRLIAEGLLGRDWLKGHEQIVSTRCIQYALPIDAQWRVSGPYPELRPPRCVRWFDGRVLSAGLGQQDGGRRVVSGGLSLDWSL